MEVLMGKSSINGPFSMANLNNQMVYIYICALYFTDHFKTKKKDTEFHRSLKTCRYPKTIGRSQGDTWPTAPPPEPRIARHRPTVEAVFS
jgi:hypothetical protein